MNCKYKSYDVRIRYSIVRLPRKHKDIDGHRQMI